MASGKQSLKQAHRKRIIREVRVRGHSNRNLWYVYSVKLKQDLVLSSDLALVYWLVFLEIDLDVVSFRQSEGSETFDFLVQKRSGELVEVELSSLDESADNSSEKSIRFSSVQVMKEAPFAIKIMKALAFAAAIRSLDCVAASNAVRAIEVSLGEGDIKSVLSKAPLVAPPIICGVLVRHFIAGHIEIDFAGKPSFGYHTQWRCRS